MKRLPPPGYAMAAFGLQRLLTRRSRSTRLSRAACAVLTAASTELLISAAAEFRRRGTTMSPLDIEKTATVVDTGVFAVTRNPMYLGMAGLLLAHAVYRRSWAALLPVGLFAGVIDTAQIAVEERSLRELFGTDFEDYADSVPRWLDARSVRNALAASGALRHP